MSSKPEIKYLNLTVCENGFIVDANNKKRVFNNVKSMAEWMEKNLSPPECRPTKGGRNEGKGS